MTRIHEVIHRYTACRSVLDHGVEIFVVGDPAGAQLHAAVRRALYQIGDLHEVWGGLLRAANAVRWRRMTQPQPNTFSPALDEAVAGVLREARLLRGLVDDESLLHQITEAAAAVRDADSPLGAELLRSVAEVGASRCAVVASKRPARAGLYGWLEQFGVEVVVPSELDSLPSTVEQSYVIGPPIFFPASLVTAPATEQITFIMPAWFGDRSVPTSLLAAQADGGLSIASKVHLIGDVAQPSTEVPADVGIDDHFYPQPVWLRRTFEDREPQTDEVEARKVLLGGGLALWLDDGERIRSLDPRQPQGYRVGYEAIEDVEAGTYLVLREGATERGAMHKAALNAIGERATSIAATQAYWKRALAQRLARDGAKQVIAELKARNVRSAARVRAWVEATLICPKHDADFTALLEWLAIPLQPAYTNALDLRRALYKASAELRQELEDAVGQADLHTLEQDGLMHLELGREGFRGMIIAEVLARAPFTEIVPRVHTRIPFPDGGAQWLE